MPADEIHNLVKKYVNKKHVVLVKRGNDAIKQSLKLAYSLGKRKLLLCDQGGWMSYPDFGEKIGFEIIILKTEDGVLTLQELHKHLSSECALLINSLAGYAAPQHMGLIEKLCQSKKAFLISDATGSIGTVHAHLGDVIFAAFGNDKPLKINFGKAGFVCFDKDSFLDHFQPYPFSEKELTEIKTALEKLPERLKFLQQKRIQILKDFAAMGKKVLFPTAYGINVIVPFDSEQEKKEIISYCENKKLEYTLCPREIRVLRNAVSIEVKRL